MSLADVTAASVLDAVAEFDQLGRDKFLSKHGFGRARTYFLELEDRWYDSKAIVGVAHGYARSDLGPLFHKDFSGGEATVAALLRRLGFDVVEIGGTGVELARRMDMWEALRAAGGPESVKPALLRELRMFGGGQGIWVDKKTTGAVTPSGVTVGLLHKGSVYSDDLTDTDVLYHYPNTDRPSGRDQAEVDATKAASRLGLPVFVITVSQRSTSLRDARLGWVRDWDDRSELFLVEFGETAPEPFEAHDSESFELVADDRKTRTGSMLVRPNQGRFRFQVLQRYGTQCAVCDVQAMELLEAAHLMPWAEGGTDDPRNGLVLCANHHRALDKKLFAVEPESTEIRLRPGVEGGALGLEAGSLRHARALPHRDALVWLWDRKDWT